MLKKTMFLMAIATPALACGAVYQCRIDGQTVFADEPCGEDATKIRVEAPNSIDLKTPKADKKAPLSGEFKHLLNGIQYIRENARSER
ncbi:DUF4124 domain-containing protein [Marinobacter sp. X15-166B]|uniref:DUF4124 domain-containing protein n=1 Tax=Marinobacter sp. X15-166B TaxID=1897620 RepID=UPI00085BB49E|nr:DUF4124 domain-containing protein [Marinobacter sp. X15-166B]OEY67773.1 hypothetical protein BG841_15955 [Marinobacter sp. X15-166B]